jgi:hypothetical protein
MYKASLSAAMALCAIIAATGYSTAQPFPQHGISNSTSENNTVRHVEQYRIVHWVDLLGGSGRPVKNGSKIDKPVIINCKSAAGCTVEIDATVTIGGATASDGWEICATVDNMYITSPSCWSQGSFPANGVVTGSSRQSVQFPEGKHTFLTKVLVPTSDARVKSYSIDYIVMIP